MPILKFLHLFGLAMFLGSIPGHIILGMVGPGGDIPDQGVMFARNIIEIITLVVTAPGLILLSVTGFCMWWHVRAERRWNGGPSAPWLSVHLILGLAMLANGLGIITPAVMSLADQARTLVETGLLDQAAWESAKLTEDAAGMVNVTLALVSMGIAIGKPAFARWRKDAFDRSGHRP